MAEMDVPESHALLAPGLDGSYAVAPQCARRERPREASQVAWCKRRERTMGMRGPSVVLAWIAALCLPLFVGCGGDSGSDSGKGKADGKKGGEGAKAAPAQKSWTDQAFDAYEGALKETVALLEDAPPAAEALPKLKAIRDKYVEVLVPLGREREAMDAATRTQAESQLRTKVMDIYNTDPELYKKYQKLCTETYRIEKAKTDEEKGLNKLLTGMNIITQYAHFDLLKTQEPKEAERLGIK
jgi:hypothetical protein